MTTSQVMQVCSGALIAILTVLLASAPAQAGFKKHGFTQADFFDFDRARGYWTQMLTRDELESAYNTCISGPYGDWEKVFLSDANKAMKELETHKSAEEIKACYDLQMTYNVFARMYVTWRDGRFLRPEPFNQTTRLITCAALETINVFTGQCNDMPDWREPKNRIKDQAVLERYLERQAKAQ